MKPWRAVAIVAAFASLLVVVRFGWSVTQERIARWMSTDHENAGWKWHVFGGHRDGWKLFQADSVKAWSSEATLRLRGIRIEWDFSENAYTVPAWAKLAVSRVDVTVLPSNSKDSSIPVFPASLQIPVKIDIELDTLQIASGGGKDSGHSLLLVEGIRARSQTPQAVNLVIDRIDPRAVSLHAGIFAKADWTESDTLRAYLSGLVSTGCCEQDSLELQVALRKKDLRSGRIHFATFIENSRGWGEAIPGLATAPALHQIDIDASALLGKGHPQLKARIGVTTDSLVFLPGMDFDISAQVDSSHATLYIKATKDGESTISAKLAAPIHKTGAPWKTSATGEIRIERLGWFLQNFHHPLDGTIHIKRLDPKGAAFDYLTDAGTEFNGSAIWKGLHWNLDAKIAATEPWAVGWVNGLSMEAPGWAHGNDSAGGALFHVTARQPRMKVVALDSLHTNLWIGPGPHLVFSNIVASDSGRTWSGTGDISLPDSLVQFNLHPTTDSVANARLEARLDGHVRISATSFPTQGLPLHLPFTLPFDGKLDGGLLHNPPIDGKSVSWVTASLRAKPHADSVHAQVAISIRDSSVQLPRISLEVGGSLVEGSLAASERALGWGLDTLRVGTDLLDLSKIVGLWPGLPQLKGKLHGHFLSQRNQGISASARLEAPQIVGADGKVIPLPDLLLWGERDTLNLGGWIPLAGSRSPFRLTATNLWEPTPKFNLLAFWGDIVKLNATGSFKDKKDLETSFKLVGSAQIPGADARLNDILVTGKFLGHRTDDGFKWNAFAQGERGVLTAVAGNPLDLRFKAVADPKEIRIDQASLSGTKNGRFDAKGRWEIDSKALSLTGQARKFRLDLGADKHIEFDSLGLSATPDSRIYLNAHDVFWHQSFQTNDEKLDIGVSQANLVLLQAKDWKKLSGGLTVDKLLFTKNFAQVGDLLQSLSETVRNKHKTSTSNASSTPLLLDVQAISSGEDIRISNNLGQAKLGFDLQVTASTDAPLINGSVVASPDSGRFGYLSRNFTLDTLRLDWNTSPPMQGTFSLSGSRMVRKNCADEQRTSVVDSSSYCQLVLSSNGSLDDPRLAGLKATDCPMDPSDDGTVGAFVALMTDCYPQPNNQTGTAWGKVVKDGTIDLAYGYGMGWFNQVLMEKLRGSKNDAIWLPDSVGLTDFPVGGVRDQLGLLALYHIQPNMDVAGVYRHTFTQSGTSTNSTPVLADNYGLSLKYRIPFWWIEEEEARKRLTDRVFLQLDANQGLDENFRRSTVFQPSLRYRWEFW